MGYSDLRTRQFFQRKGVKLFQEMAMARTCALPGGLFRGQRASYSDLGVLMYWFNNKSNVFVCSQREGWGSCEEAGSVGVAICLESLC